MIAHVNQIFPLGEADIKAVLSETEEHSPDTLFTIPCLESNSETTIVSESETDSSLYPILSFHPTLRIPNLQLSLYLKKYSKPIPVTGLFDTQAASSILNLALLPSQYWKPFHKQFLVANGETLTISQISKPIYLKFFLDLKIKHTFLASSLLGKDLLIGFDII